MKRKGIIICSAIVFLTGLIIGILLAAPKTGVRAPGTRGRQIENEEELFIG